MNLIEVPCYHCESTNFEDYDEENGYKLVKCADCGLLLVNPRPAEEDISKAKLTGVHDGDQKIATTGRYASRKVRRYTKILRDFYTETELRSKSSTWFDIGCGFGEFIEAVKKFSDSKVVPRGSELNEIKVASAQKKNLDVDFYDIDNMNETFDFVSLLNVYSHLPNPLNFLENLKKLLNDGGELFLETGHTSHLEIKDQHMPYYLPDHLSFGNQEIVESILKKIGFEIVQTRIYRSPVYPRLTNPEEVAIEFAKMVSPNHHGSLKNFFPSYPNKDMFIRARLPR